MIVFVSMRSSDSTTYTERRDALSHDWSKWFDSHGITPVPVLNSLDAPEQLLDEIPGRALLLSGGDSIGDTPRNRTEQRLLACAVERRLPVFGVCRGLQMINVFFGGGLSRGTVTGHVATQHEVTILDDIAGALPSGQHTVNSYHDDCVLENELSKELRLFAAAPSGIVEGLYHPSLPITAVQWHVERRNPAATLDDALLKRWVTQCD